MAVIFASLLASAVLHGLLASGQTHLDQLDADLRQERTELAREQLELANLRSPERIAAEAAADGMVPATTVHWMSAASGDETVVLRDGSGEADEATPEATTDDPAATTAQELASGTAGGTDR